MKGKKQKALEKQVSLERQKAFRRKKASEKKRKVSREKKRQEALKNRKPKRTVKDSVFRKFFSDKANVARFYNDYHRSSPVQESDVEDITLRNVFIKGLSNDLGFNIRGKKIVLVEAQSAWDKNIIVRAFLYLIDTLSDFFSDEDLKELHAGEDFDFPETEVYIVYTGDRKTPDVISLREYMGEKKTTAVDCQARVLRSGSVIGVMKEYTDFCGILTQSIQRRGRTMDAVNKAMDECIEKGIMVQFLQSHENEIRRSIMDLWNQEKINRWVRTAEREKAIKEGRAIGRSEGRAIGRSEGRAIGRSEGRAIGRSEGRAIGRSEGRAIGRSEGRSEGRAEGHSDSLAVIRMHRTGATTEDIATKLSLPLDFVRELTGE